MEAEITRYLASAIGTVLLIAAAAKRADGGAFAVYLARAGLRDRTARPLATAVPAVEAVVGALLLTGVVLRVVGVVAAGLAALFLLVQLREVHRHGLRGGCRCFGALDSGEPSAVPLVRAAVVFAGALPLAALVLVGDGSVGAFTGDEAAAATVVGTLSGAAVVAAFTVAGETAAFERWRRGAEAGL